MHHPARRLKKPIAPHETFAPQKSLSIVRSTFLITYDVSDAKRLRSVFQFLKGFGDHLQYSVFECQLTPRDLVECREGLRALIHHKEDQVLFVNLGPSEGRGDRVITALGKPYTNLDAPCIIV